jgi:hypothetical protein
VPFAICDTSRRQKRPTCHIITEGICALSVGSTRFDFIDLSTILNTPQIVFSDLPVTKIGKHFALHNIELLLNNGLVQLLTYTFPLYLSDAAVFEASVCRLQRLILRETAFADFSFPHKCGFLGQSFTKCLPQRDQPACGEVASNASLFSEKSYGQFLLSLDPSRLIRNRRLTFFALELCSPKRPSARSGSNLQTAGHMKRH